MCPFLENADARCAGHLTLDRLSAALEHCADRYQQCPAYREILKDVRQDQPARRRLALAS